MEPSTTVLIIFGFLIAVSLSISIPAIITAYDAKDASGNETNNLDVVLTQFAPSGTVMSFANAVTPDGWLKCDGSAYDVSKYIKLFTEIGFTFGGTGSNFNVPDLRGRGVIGAGSGTGLTTRVLAHIGGEEEHTLLATETPSDLLPVNDDDAEVDSDDPTDAFLCAQSADQFSTTASVGAFAGSAGTDTPFNVMSPFIVLNHCIKT